jgi:uncharacterized protein YbbC (DUF1343 family)
MKLTKSLKCTFTILLTLLCINSQAHPRTSLGVDQLLTAKYIRLVEHKNIAIVANDASRDSYNRRDITLLHQNPHIHLVSIFTPEHGLNVNKNNSHIKDSYDSVTGLPVYSLYGKHRYPTSKELANTDVIIFDLQSVGLRYYTYISTLAHVMKMAKRYHKELIVLDRPNPLGGKIVYGPLLDSDYVGKFTSFYNVPMRYGMTIGEVARYYNRYNNQHVDLKVIPMKYWKRSMLFNQTGLTWNATSPALRHFNQAYLYAIFGPLESTRLSFGLGKESPEEYHLFGAPYITKQQALHIAHRLQGLHLPGLKFRYAYWRPVGGNYRHRWCRGFHVDITNYNKIHGFHTLVATLEILHQELGNRLGIIGTDNMLGQRWVRRDIANNTPVNTITKQVRLEQTNYRTKRQHILIYQ